jgi:cytochrome b pre-mRNA-processing protein 3
MIGAWLRRRKSIKLAAAGLYQAAVTQSRDPKFYTDLGVEDTLDGRFDLITLHAFLVMQRLVEIGSEGKAVSQSMFDQMFKHMDMGLRETGVGDMGIPKHMKRMMRAFNGRVNIYYEAIKSNDRASLEDAVARNIYRVEKGDMPLFVGAISDYILQQVNYLHAQEPQELLAGRILFMDVFGSEENKRDVVNG